MKRVLYCAWFSELNGVLSLIPWDDFRENSGWMWCGRGDFQGKCTSATFGTRHSVSANGSGIDISKYVLKWAQAEVLTDLCSPEVGTRRVQFLKERLAWGLDAFPYTNNSRLTRARGRVYLEPHISWFVKSAQQHQAVTVIHRMRLAVTATCRWIAWNLRDAMQGRSIRQAKHRLRSPKCTYKKQYFFLINSKNTTWTPDLWRTIQLAITRRTRWSYYEQSCLQNGRHFEFMEKFREFERTIE